jgi:DUF3068 family protein
MRVRVVGLVLVGLAGCALAVAVLARAWLLPSVDELPLAPSFQTVAVGDDVTYLDPATLTQRTSDEVSISVRVRGDARSGDAGEDTAVWGYEATTSDGDGTLITTTTEVLCLDRRSAEAVDCATESDDQRTDVRGLAATFPPGTQARDHDVWEGTVRQALPARFAGTERLRGVLVDRFEQAVPERVVDTFAVPGSLLGSDEETVTADVVHGNTRTLWVEPVSGVVVSSEESPVTVLRGPDGGVGPVLLDGTFRASEETVDDALARAADVRDRLGLRGTVVPWTAAGLGAVLLAGGLLLVVRSRSAAARSGEDEPVRVPVPTA